MWGGYDNPILLTNYINQLLSALDCGQAVIFLIGYESEFLASNLNRKSSEVIRPLNNTLVIASVPKDGISSADG